MYKNLKQKYGKTALVAGASEGLGAAFAEYLAAEDIDIILLARRLQPLQQLAETLKEKYKVNVTCISCDLGDINAPKKIEAVLSERSVNILVYNAALSYLGPFTDNPAEDNSYAARVNMMSPLHMVQMFGEKMLARKKGAVILMTSMAGLQGSLFKIGSASCRIFCTGGAHSGKSCKRVLPQTWKASIFYNRKGKQTGILYYAKAHAPENGCKYNGKYYQEDVPVMKS